MISCGVIKKGPQLPMVPISLSFYNLHFLIIAFEDIHACHQLANIYITGMAFQELSSIQVK